MLDLRLGKETTLKLKSLLLSYNLVPNLFPSIKISKSKKVDVVESSLVRTISNSFG